MHSVHPYDNFHFQVMTVGQRVSFEYHGNNYIFTVNQAEVEGKERSNGPERGMISSDTYIVFEASNPSGIKVNCNLFPTLSLSIRLL